jgi:hypothetical protein
MTGAVLIVLAAVFFFAMGGHGAEIEWSS